MNEAFVLNCLTPEDLEEIIHQLKRTEEYINSFEKIGPNSFKMIAFSKEHDRKFAVFFDIQDQPENGAVLSIMFLSDNKGVTGDLLNEWNESNKFSKAYVGSIHDRDFLILRSDLMIVYGVTNHTVVRFIDFFLISWAPRFIEFLRSY